MVWVMGIKVMLIDFKVTTIAASATTRGESTHMTTLAKPTTVRFDETEKAEATAILGSIGLSFNAYLNLAVRQLINQGRVPFELAPAKEVPNETTRRAMVEAEAKELGLLPDDAPTFSDADELLAYLDAR